MSEKLSWGIIGAGQIARTFVTGVNHGSTGRVVAIASRDQSRADQFGDEMNVPKRYGTYDAILNDPEVQAIYVATPHPDHAQWTIKSAQAKKHVLCEKPIGVNAAEARRMIEAARQNDVFLMEAFMYRCHPQTARLVQLIREKAIGEVRMIQATFGFSHPFDPNHRLWSNALAGGGILDVGCYPISFSRLIAGAAVGKDFLNPHTVVGAAKLHPTTGIDEYAAGVLRFPNDVIAQVSTSVGVEQESVARIYGTTGWIYIPEPWTASNVGQPSKVFIYRQGQSPQELVFESGDWLYAIEADTVARNLSRRQAPPPAMTWDDTIGNAETLDQWRAAIGLQYDFESLQQGR